MEVVNRSHRVKYKQQSFDEIFTSMMQKMRKKAAIQTRDKASNRKDFISIIDCLLEFKHAWKYSGIHEGATVWLFQDFMTIPRLATMRARSTMYYNNFDKSKGTMELYSEYI